MRYRMQPAVVSVIAASAIVITGLPAQAAGRPGVTRHSTSHAKNTRIRRGSDSIARAGGAPHAQPQRRLPSGLRGSAAVSGDDLLPDPYSLSQPIADDVTSALQLAQQLNAPVIVESLLTDTSTTLINPDGSFTADLTAGVVHTHNAAGNWVDIDTTLLTQGDRLSAAATDGDVSFSSGGSTALARQTVDGVQAGMDWPTSLPDAYTQGNTAVYPNVASNTDLLMSALPDGFELSLRLNRRPTEAPTFEVPLSLPDGWSAMQLPNGVTSIRDADGTERQIIGNTLMYDALVDPLSGQPLHSIPVDVSLATIDGEPTLVLQPDNAFLQDPEIRYPVTIDPSDTLSDTFDTDVDQAFPTQNYPGNPENESGHYYDNGTNGKKRSFIQFNTTPIQNQQVTSATLNLWLLHQWACQSEPTVVDDVVGLVGSGATWNNQNSVNTQYESKFYTNAGDTCGGRTWVTDSTNNFTDEVNHWTGLSSPQQIRLSALDESDNFQYHEFASRDFVSSTGTTKPPSIDVNYNTLPCAPQITGISAGNQSATVTWQAPSCNGGTAITSYRTMAYTDSNDQPVSNTSHILGSSVRSDTWSGLSNGTKYYIRVWASNSVGEGPSDKSGVVTPSTLPGAPTGVTVDPCVSGTSTVHWTPPANNGGTPVTGYTITRYIGTSTTVDATSSALPVATSAPVSGMQGGSSYTFAVAATNLNGTGPNSARSNLIACSRPDPPQNVLAYGGNSTVTVTWQPPDNTAQVAPTGYQITWTDTTRGTTSGPYPAAATDRSQPFGATNGDYYYAIIWATSAAGPGLTAQSNTVLASGPPNAPTGVTAHEDSGEHTGTSSATVSWNIPASNGYPIDQYAVQATDTATNAVTRFFCTSCPPMHATGLAYGHTYTFQAAAHNASASSNNSDLGTGWSAWSSPSSPVTIGNHTVVSKTLLTTVPNGTYASQTAFERGQAVVYRITLTNPNSSDLTIGAITDALAGSTQPGQPVQPLDVGSNPIIDVHSNITGDTTCQATCISQLGTSLQLTHEPLLRVGETRTYTIYGVLTGTPSGAASDSAMLCQTLTNTVDVVDDYAGNGGITNPPAHAFATASPTICNAGLGLEPWWTYLTQSIGAQSTAQINVGNGNLVLSSTDGTPVQAHGHLAYVVRRTYNSQDATIETLPGSFGRGWQLNLGDTGDLAATGITGAAIMAPSVQSALTTVQDPLGVTMVDRDGTRHVFTPATGLPAISVITGLPTALSNLTPVTHPNPDPGYTDICVDTSYVAPPGVHLGLWRYIEVKAATGATNPCVGYNTNPSNGPMPAIIGWGAERPDRLRTEYDAQGRLVDMKDGAGAELRYTWSANGLLTRVTDQPQCNSSCREITLRYFNSSGADVTSSVTQSTLSTIASARLTDPAGRQTTYGFTTVNGIRYLTQVTNPDTSTLSYRYEGVNGVTCHANSGQLCVAVDERGNTTSFTYDADAPTHPTLAPARVVTITDRRGNPTALAYSSRDNQAGNSTAVTEDAGTNGGDAANTDRQQVYGPIDADGRVWQLIEGAAGVTSSTALRVTSWTWDGHDPQGTQQPGCRSDQTDHTQDNNLCARTRNGSTNTQNSGHATPDQTSFYVYNDLGMLTRQAICVTMTTVNGVPRCATSGFSSAVANQYLTTTYGYDRQWYTTDGTRTTGTDTVADLGVVQPAADPSGTVLYALADQNTMVPPRGNENSGGVNTFAVHYVHDNTSTVAPNQPPAAGVPCYLNGTYSANGNTGLLCSTKQPISSGTAVTSHRYDATGAMTVTDSPNGNDTTYAYYNDGDRSLTNQAGTVATTSAGGWLKTVTDAAGNFVAFGYDAAGNVVRTWDRNATDGHNPSAYPGSIDQPGPGPFTQQLYGAADATAANAAIGSPWRYLTASTDQVGALTTYTHDSSGDVINTVDPRGNRTRNCAPSTATDSCYDPDGNLLYTAAPAEGGNTGTTAAPTTFSYDSFDEAISRTSPVASRANTQAGTPVGQNVSSRMTYDTVGRLTRTDTVRQTNASGGPPAGCYTTGSGSDPLLPSGAIVCVSTTAYDSEDHPVDVTDSSGASTLTVYDADGRVTDTYAPAPGAGGPAHTAIQYDPDGNLFEVCRPRQFTEGPGTCPANGAGYLTRYTVDQGGRRTSMTTYRSPTATAVTTGYGYDADNNVTTTSDPNGNVTFFTYNSLDRLVQTEVPRFKDGFTDLYTRYLYDPSGDRIATVAPGSGSDNVNTSTRITAASFDADHRPVDTVSGLQVNFDPTNNSPLYDSSRIPDIAAALANATATGKTNTRYRTVYDAVGNVVARYEPRAFTSSVPSATGGSFADAPGGFSSAFMTRTDYDADNRPTEQYSPRTDNSVTDPNSHPAGSPEAAQCVDSGPTTAGLPTYPSGTGTCHTTASYDPDGNVTGQTLATATADTGNRRMTYAYTADDLLASVTGPDPSSTTAGTGRTTLATYTYDGAGRALTATDALGLTTRTTYSPAGNVTEIDDPPASGSGPTHITRYTYDADANRTSIIVPRIVNGSVENDTTSTAYTADDLVASVTAPGANTGDHDVTGYTYDLTGNVTAVTPPSATAKDATNSQGLTTTNTYTPDNLLATTRIPINTQGTQFRRTTYTYDAAGRKASVVTDVVGPIVNGTSQVITAGSPQQFNYAANDRLIKQTGRSDSTAYEAVIDTTYDAAGNTTCVLTGPAANDSCANPTRTADSATYYLDGQLRSATQKPIGQPTRTTSYSLDAAGDITARTQDTATNTTATATYTLNDAGLALTMQAPVEGANSTTNWTYNADGQPLTETDPNGTIRNWHYDAGDDTLTSLGLSSSTSANSDLAHYTYTYDSAYRLLTDTHTGTQAGSANTLTPTTFTYTYQPDGRLASFKNGSAAAQTVTWDHDGNRLTYGGATFTYNPDDTMATSQASATSLIHTYSYDVYGRETTDGCINYGYDGFDRMTLTTLIRPNTDASCPTGTGTGSDKITYNHDGLDRQTARTETTQATGQSAVVTSSGFWYDGTSSTLAYQSYNSGATRTYTLTDDGQPDAVTIAAGTTQYLFTDRTGSLTNTTTSTGGTTGMACALRYDPFGTTISDNTTGTAVGCETGSTTADIRYQAVPPDSTTNTYQFGARTYDPTKDAFTTPDTYRDAPSTADLSIRSDPLTADTYTYVNGDPVNLSDPTGHMLSPTDCNGSCQRAVGRARAAGLRAEALLEQRQAQRRLADVAYAAQFLQAMALYDQYWGTGDIPQSATEQRLVAAYAAFFQRAGAAFASGRSITQLQALALAHDYGRQGTTSDATMQTFLDAASLTGIGKLGVAGGRLAVKGVLKGIDRVLAREVGDASLETLGKGGADLLSGGAYTLYLAGSVEEPTYIGITRAFAARKTAHRLVRDIWPLVDGLSATEARGAEQVMIDYYGLGKLDNVINSIALNNPVFYERVQEGISVLSRAGVLARLP